MQWNFNTDKPIYSQLVEQITTAILSNEFSAGEKLPSVRDLAQEAAVNPNTMQKALAELERVGLVYTQRTAGRYITEDSAMIEKTKSELATRQLQQFVQQMQSIGITRGQLIEMLQNDSETTLK